MRPAGAKSKRNRDSTYCATGQDAGHRKRQQVSGLKAMPQYGKTAGIRNATTELEDGLLATDCTYEAYRGDEATGETDLEHRLTSERLQQWGMHMHVDHVFDLVPFWCRAVDAAERGEELRLEEFLEQMEGDGGWRIASDVWNLLADQKSSRKAASDLTHMDEENKGWGIAEDWAMPRHNSDGRSNKDWDTPQNWTPVEHDHAGWNVAESWDITGQATLHRTGDSFVDSVARREAVSEERRKQMHKFFQMPTEQKIREIEEIIQTLHTQHRYP